MWELIMAVLTCACKNLVPKVPNVCSVSATCKELVMILKHSTIFHGQPNIIFFQLHFICGIFVFEPLRFYGRVCQNRFVKVVGD